MNQSELARLAGLGLSTVVDFEKGRRRVSQDAIDAMRRALQKAGIALIDENGGGEGIRLREPRRPKRKK